MSRPSFGRKGFFSILTAFILVVIIVFALIAFLSLYGMIYKVRGLARQQTDMSAAAQAFRDRLLLCHSKTQLSEAKFVDNPCVTLAGVRGYKVVQDAQMGCPARLWSEGSVDDAAARFVYPVAVVQNATGRTCIARLFVYPELSG